MNTSISPRLRKQTLTFFSITTLAILLFLIISGFRIDPMNTGVVFEVETTYHSDTNKPVEKAQMSVLGPNLLKIEIMPGKEAKEGQTKDEVIFRADRKEMVTISHAEKSYFVLDEDMLASLGGQMKKVQEMMKDINIPKEVLDQMPAADRKKLEAMMNNKQMDAGISDGSEASKKEYRNTKERASQQGYPCVKYEVLKEGEKVRELWVTDWKNVEGGEEAAEVFKEMASFFKEIKASMGKMMGGEGLFEDNDNSFEDFWELDGFPIVTRSFKEGVLEEETALRSAKRQSLDPAEFEPPSGYKRQSMGPR